MMRLLKHAIKYIFHKKEEKPVWLHHLKIKHCTHCPPETHHCAVVWENGCVMDKCRYAKITDTDAEICVYSKMGITIGVRCIPSNALDFILSDS